MPDAERLERAWKLHQRAQNDNGAEAATARSLRNKILVDEGLTVAQLEERFNPSSHVPPFGRPSQGPRPGAGFGSAWSSFGSAFGGVDIEEQIRRAAEETRRMREEQQRKQAQAKRAAYREFVPEAMMPLIEEMIRIYRSDGSDKEALRTLLKVAGDLATCQAQLESQADKLDRGELNTQQAMQQAFRALLRNGRKQTEALSTVIGMLAIYVGSRSLEDDAQAFDEHFGRSPG